MKKKILFGLLSMMALTLAACGGSEQPSGGQSSEPSSQPQSQPASSEPASEPAGSSDAGSSDAGSSDAGSSEAGSSEAGSSEDVPTTRSVAFTANQEQASWAFTTCVPFAHYWDEDGHAGWAEGQVSDDLGTFTVSIPDYSTGALVVRCAEGTTQPDWNAEGDAAGRIYNKTDNVVLTEATSYEVTFSDYTPEPGGGEGEGGEGGEVDPSKPTTGMAVVVNGTTYLSLTNEGAWDMDPTYTQYSYKVGAELKVGDILSFYDADNDASWASMAIDPANTAELSEATTGIQVGKDGTYDIYIKMKMGLDNIYLGDHPLA